MKITFLVVGKTTDDYLIMGINEYLKRIKRYIKIEIKELLSQKKTGKISENNLKEKEGISILNYIESKDYVVLLDNNGQHFDSNEFAKFIQERMNQSTKHLIFVVGGAYGFSEEVYERCNFKLSLSKLTFPHQLIRLIFTEQLYRSFTIINNEPYHHQ